MMIEDIAKLEAQNQILARTVAALIARVSAIEFAYDSLPEAFVVPGPDGELPQMVVRAPLFPQGDPADEGPGAEDGPEFDGFAKRANPIDSPEVGVFDAAEETLQPNSN